MVSDILHQKPQLISIMDVEPFFKTGSTAEARIAHGAPKGYPAINHHPFCDRPRSQGTVGRGWNSVDYPKSVQDVLTMATVLRGLGPDYVIIKREILEEDENMTLLHYVLCGIAEPLMVTFRCENPKGTFGASYSIPCECWIRLATDRCPRA